MQKRILIFLTLFTLAVMPFVSYAQFGQPDQPGQLCPPGQICNPLKGVGSLTGFLQVIIENIILPIGSIVVVIMIIYSGFLFVVARGNTSKLEIARRNFLYVVIGAAVLLGAWVISAAISGTICQVAGVLCPSGQLPSGAL